MFTVQVFLEDSSIQTMEENMEKPTIDDALEYIKHVKHVLLHLNEGKNKYDQFGSALDQFYRQKISAEVLLAQVEILFEGRENLLSGFKIFLPKKQETKRVIRIVRRNKKNSIYESKKQSCHEFLERVRVRFAGNPEVCSLFLEMMIKYESGELNITEVSEKVFTLLIGHADLVYEFECFFNDQDCETRKDVENIRVCTIDDYMNEMEVVLWNLRTLIRRVEEALELLKLDPSVEEVQDPFKGLSFRCFERFYGEFGLEKIEAMKNSPKGDFPVIFTQLKKKEEELLRYRSHAHDFLVEIRKMHCNARKRKATVMVDDCWDRT